MDAREGRRRDFPRRTSPTRVALAWAGALLALVLVFSGGVVALNATVFGAGGFVTTYLQALGARDVASVLEMPGVALPPGLKPNTLEATLLGGDTLSTIGEISIESDTELDDGVHQVTATYTLEGAKRESTRTQSDFLVRPQGTNYGVFTRWMFATPPVATLSVAVKNATSFTAGNHELDAAALGSGEGAFGAGAHFPVLVPALVVLSHDSHYLASEVDAVTLARPGDSKDAMITAKPTQAFTDAVRAHVKSFLDDCAAQKALFPAGCPFGKAISDRIEGTPTWSIVTYPQISILPGAASWLLGQNAGAAHVEVQVKSLFDGTVSTLSEDVPFIVNYAVTLTDDDRVTFAARTL